MMRNRINVNIPARSSMSSSAISNPYCVFFIIEKGGRLYDEKKPGEAFSLDKKLKSISLFLKNLPL